MLIYSKEYHKIVKDGLALLISCKKYISNAKLLNFNIFSYAAHSKVSSYIGVCFVICFL